MLNVFGTKYIALPGGHMAIQWDNAILSVYKGLTSGHSRIIQSNNIKTTCFGPKIY